MTTVVDGKWIDSHMTQNAAGGTELMTHRLIQYVNADALKGCQIHLSRVTTGLDPAKKQFLYLHDLHNDPACDHLSLSADRWDAIIFVSHWQRQQFHNKFTNLDWNKTHVINNAIEPLKMTTTTDGPIRLIYTSTPHRGLGLLFEVFKHISKHFDVRLDVFSSFKLYGWEERDKPFQKLFDELKNHEHITYHGSKSNDEVREALESADIFAYPSIWPETSCLCLIEAMSAGLTCVHSSLAALPETSKGITWQYDFTDDMQTHANRFFNKLYTVCSLYDTNGREFMRTNGYYGKQIVDSIHNMNKFKQSWETLLQTTKKN
jgi:glycosyltransferase involved in cell wall biosynthesis